MKKLQALLAAGAGAAAAIPGMEVLSELDVPGESEPLFKFVLAAFSAASVLTIYLLRGKLGALRLRKAVGIAVLGLLLVLGSFFAHVWVSNKVLVPHQYRGVPERQFVPLFLPDSVDTSIEEYGSRSQFLTEIGPDSLIKYISETDIAWTLVVMLLIYTVLVVSLASTFGVLGVQALEADPGG